MTELRELEEMKDKCDSCIFVIQNLRAEIDAIKQCQKEAFFDGFYAGYDADRLVDAKRCWAKFQARREATS